MSHRHFFSSLSVRIPGILFALFLSVHGLPAERQGYYREPALRGDTLIFVSEGDLWKVSVNGGSAVRLTTHPGRESGPVLSPDGTLVAFTAEYEGPTEIYTMPLSGGLPVRRTFEGRFCTAAGFHPDGRLVYATQAHSGLPDTRLHLLDLATGEREPIPLAQAAQGTWTADRSSLVFTRLSKQSSHTKRYTGGTAENLWRFSPGAEAVPLTDDYPGTSAHPMTWGTRIAYLTDRGGSMNLWSMNPDGTDLRQHTRHLELDVKSPALDGDTVVYQLGADLRRHNLVTGEDTVIPITLPSDFDQMRERWVKNPMDYVTSVHLSPDGDRLVLTARGEVFVVPVKAGRLAEITRKPGVRYRQARFMPDGQTLVALSDETGEVEVWTLPANGIGEPKALTADGKVLRWDAVPSPDGKWIAHHDKDWELWMLETATGRHERIDVSRRGNFNQLAWSPDSRRLAYVVEAPNSFRRIRVYDTVERSHFDVTSDRYNSGSPEWDPRGKWLYFFSDRHFRSLVSSPWGDYQPEPFFDRRTLLYQVALVPGLKSPFRPRHELDPRDDPKPAEGKQADETPAVQVEIVREGIQERIYPVPLENGNHDGLGILEKRILFISSPDRHRGKWDLMALAISDDEPKPEVLVPDIEGYDLSADGKKLLVRKDKSLYVIASDAAAPAKLDKAKVDLNGWTFSLDPREEWEQMFIEAWRLERDYFYDRGLHNVDWDAVRQRYQPLVGRVSDRAELSDLIAQMVSELSALHIFVRGGDLRSGTDQVQPASLGAGLERDAQGFRITHLPLHDPDRPELRSPLRDPELDLAVGDVITHVDGVSAAGVPDLGQLLRNRAGRQVRLSILDGGTRESRDVIAVPITTAEAADRRYHEWQYTRRLQVEEASRGRFGYVHLRSMGPEDMAQWTREFYPAFNREGLIIDVRHNRGGNIDSWILEKLLRRAWFYWQGRTGDPYWNMQYAFRGHMVVLVNEWTASDGEAFAEGFRRLGLGKLIGTRTWGGEIWLTSSNFLVDRGIATAAEFGVFGPEGEWLIEGHGVDPDVVVDNLPHATFTGVDRQLEAAIAHLEQRLAEDPIPVPTPPPGPDKSLRWFLERGR